jgi:hypothetical protein
MVWTVADGGNGHAYQAVAVADTIGWNEAQVWATERGGHLATVATEAENQFVFRLVDDERYWSNNSGHHVGPLLGGRRETDGVGREIWRWVNNEGAFTYTNWGTDQPNNNGGNENYLAYYSGQDLTVRRATWNDASANATIRGFVVEYPDTVRAAGGAPAGAVATAQQALTTEQMGGIVLIEGDKGAASGFLAKIRNVEVVVTNLHVVGDNEKLVVKTLGGTTIAWSGIIGAVGSDIALLRVTKPTGVEPVLRLAENVARDAKIGDTVVVVGNRLGGGVATQTIGRIQGVGPERVEVDARFQPGNSGSPIFDTVLQRVVGVATYVATARPGGMGVEDSELPFGGSLSLRREERWFGYRLDNVARWETVDWARWRTQMRSVREYRDTSLALLALVMGELTEGRENARLRPLIERYQTGRAAAEARNNAFDAAARVRDLMQAAGTYAQEGLRTLDTPDLYDFFRTSGYWETNVVAQVKFREALVKALKEIEGDARLFQQRVRR